MLYVLIKVLRVPEDHELSWQMRMRERDIDLILGGQLTINITSDKSKNKRSYLRRRSNDDDENNDENENNRVERIGFEMDELCIICQDSLGSEDCVTWCQFGCGNNFHASCMMSFAQHKISSKEIVSCPLCRHSWVEEDEKEMDEGGNKKKTKKKD